MGRERGPDGRAHQLWRRYGWRVPSDGERGGAPKEHPLPGRLQPDVARRPTSCAPENIAWPVHALACPGAGWEMRVAARPVQTAGARGPKVPRSQQHNVKWGGGAKETGECCHPIWPRATRRVTCTPVAPCNALTRPPVGARTLRPDQRRAGVREDAGAAAYESRSGSAARTWHAQRTRLRGPPAKQDRMRDRTTERQNGALLGTGDASTATNRGPMKP